MERPINKPPHGLRLPAKATIYYIMTSALAKSIGIITTPIFTRLLSSEEYGKYTLYMTTLGIFTLISSSAVSSTVIYRGIEKFKEEKESFIFSSLLTGFGFTGLICIVLFTFSPILGLDNELCILLSLQLFCDITASLYQTERRYDYAFRSLCLTSSASLLLSPLLALLLTGAGVGYRGRIYALLFVSLLFSAFHISKFLIKSKSRAKKALSLYVIKRSLPLMPSSISSAVSGQLDKLMIAGMLGAESLAKYSVAHTLGLSLGVAASAVSSSLYPWVMRKLSAGLCHAVEPVFRGILLSLSALGISVALLTPELFSLLAPKSYASASLGTLPLILSTLPSFSSAFISLGMVHAEHGGYSSYSALISLALGITLNLILIPPFKYIGAGLSLLISSLAALPVSYSFLKKCKRAEIFSPVAFIKIFLLSLLGVFLAALFRESPALRLLLLSLPVTMLLYAYSGVRELIRE